MYEIGTLKLNINGRDSNENLTLQIILVSKSLELCHS